MSVDASFSSPPSVTFEAISGHVDLKRRLIGQGGAQQTGPVNTGVACGPVPFPSQRGVGPDVKTEVVRLDVPTVCTEARL